MDIHVCTRLMKNLETRHNLVEIGIHCQERGERLFGHISKLHSLYIYCVYMYVCIYTNSLSPAVPWPLSTTSRYIREFNKTDSE